MHIAVYDDNYVDRNQMNRLLTRASDENKKNGVEGYFIDLFGSLDMLMHNIAMYDAIFLDIVNEAPFGHDIANQLFELGINGKIILCNSTIQYKEMLDINTCERYLFINKPIKADELRTVLDECEELRLHREPKIEIRTDTDTIYIKAEEFLYANVPETGRVKVTLMDGRSKTFLGDINSFYRDLSHFSELVLANSKTIININYIKKIQTLKITMTDDSQFMGSLSCLNKINKLRK